MNDDTRLNEILSKRDMPPPATNLASRIAEAAKIRKPGQSLPDIIMQEIAAMIVIPRPAYAIAACLIFGLIIGSQIGTDISLSAQDLFSFADITQEGDWL